MSDKASVDPDVSMYNPPLSAFISVKLVALVVASFVFPFITAQENAQTGAGIFNFGNPPFTISSGNADANGHGNFEYAVPSGYYSLCTKNLAEFG